MGLINSRSACAIEIGRIKRTAGLPVYAPEREAWILDRVMRENPGPARPHGRAPRVRADHRREPAGWSASRPRTRKRASGWSRPPNRPLHPKDGAK